MSVYRSKKSPYWQFDFIIRGRRFHGSTGQVTRRAAETTERRLRIEAADGRLGEASALTLDQAAGKWWAEVGHARADRADAERRLAGLLALIGKNKVLADITTADVSEAIQRRKAQTYQKSPSPKAKRYLPSNATVNRDIIETLRPILRRAQMNWGAKGLPGIAWGDLKLQEPRGVVKTYSPAEQAAWLAECGPAARLALQLLLRYGLRLGELFFDLDAFDPVGRRLAIRKRKRDVPLVIPLRKDDARAIAARVGRAMKADLEHIWYAEGDGELLPLTYYGLQSRLNGAADRAGVTPGRRIHGTRHHAGTEIVRRSKSLKLAQELLGHADIKSTMRYAHALEDDLRAALEDLPRNSPGPKRRPAKKAS